MITTYDPAYASLSSQVNYGELGPQATEQERGPSQVLPLQKGGEKGRSFGVVLPQGT